MDAFVEKFKSVYFMNKCLKRTIFYYRFNYSRFIPSALGDSAKIYHNATASEGDEMCALAYFVA